VKNALSKLASSSLLVLSLVTFLVAEVFSSSFAPLINIGPLAVIKSAGQNGKPITGVPGRADRSAAINFSDLPQKEPASTQLKDDPEPKSEVEDKALPADAFLIGQIGPIGRICPIGPINIYLTSNVTRAGL